MGHGHSLVSQPVDVLCNSFPFCFKQQLCCLYAGIYPDPGINVKKAWLHIIVFISLVVLVLTLHDGHVLCLCFLEKIRG